MRKNVVLPCGSSVVGGVTVSISASFKYVMLDLHLRAILWRNALSKKSVPAFWIPK